ncbi:MAG: cell division protein FtsA [Nonlabens sp.]
MELTDYAVGLDIGTTKIVAMIGRRNEYGKLEILGVGRSKSLGVHRGVVNNITQTITSIQQAVSQAEAVSGINVKEVTVGIAGQHIRSLQHSDYITRENSDEVIGQTDVNNLCNQVYKLVMLPGEEIIHVLPQEYKIDGQSEIKEPIGMYGGRLEANFHVVVGQVTSIRNIYRCVKSADLDINRITLEPLASAEAVISQEEKEAGVALIDIGGGTTDLAIFKDGIIRHTAVIPQGGNIITEDIKEGCSIIEKQAELLKVKFGSAWPGENKENEIVSIPGLRGREPKEITLKNLSKIIHARVIEILETVFVEIKNYGHDEPKKQLIAGVILTGGGSQLKHIKQLAEYVMGMPTRIGYPNEHLAGDSDTESTSPMFATAVGLVMKGLESNHMKNSDSGDAVEPATDATQDEQEKDKPQTTVDTPPESSQEIDQDLEDQLEQEEKSTITQPTKKKGIFDSWASKFKDFLDNAE